MMKKFSVSVIGQFHTNHNEDFLLVSEIGKNKLLIAVMDGCSMATDSHFASTLVAKLLKNIAKQADYIEFVAKEEKTLEQLIEAISRKLFENLVDLKNRIGLSREELLTTLVLGVVDVESKMAEILVVGDGLVVCNSNFFEYDQDNKPDYLGYHLEKNFENWFAEQKQRLHLKDFNDLSISTDGIFTFKKFDNIDRPKVILENEIVEFLLLDNFGFENENMLKQKILKIESQYGLKPSDDLTIIRLIIG